MLRRPPADRSAPVARLVGLAEFDIEDAEWRALAASAVEANPFFSPYLLRPALASYAGDDLRMAIVRDGDGALIALAPLASARGYSRLPVGYVATYMHPHCYFAAPLIRAGAEDAAFAALFALADRRGLFLRLRHLDAHGALIAAAERAAAATGRLSARSSRYERAELRGRFAAEAVLEAAYTGKKRKELRRLRARLEEQGAVSFDRLDRIDEAPAWIDAFLALEASGWKGREGTALAIADGGAAFFREATLAALAVGAVDVFRLRSGEKTIAMIANFGERGETFSFKIAYDEDYARFSPGVMIEIEMMNYYEADSSLRFIDSCAQANHPMINSLWRERRTIEALNVSRRDSLSKAAFRVLTGLEDLAARRRARAQEGDQS